jgi:hypothetical protein
MLRDNYGMPKANILMCLMYLVGALIVAGFLYVETVATYRTLANDGVSTTGIVTALEPRNHATVHARFVVESVTYVVEQGRTDGFGNPEFDELAVGDAVRVTYLPEDPTQSCLGDADARFDNAVTDMVILSLVVPATVIGVMWLGHRRLSS